VVQEFGNAGVWFLACPANFGRLLVVYFRIAQISRFIFGLPTQGKLRHGHGKKATYRNVNVVH
jgi:hypothetical protein